MHITNQKAKTAILLIIKIHYNKKVKKTIGRSDKATFKELNIENIPIKIDTGAYTSSIYCSYWTIAESEEKPLVTFILLDKKHAFYTGKKITFPIHKIRKVKNSFGKTEERISIKTKIILFNKEYSVELTIAKRKEMRFPVLIGRKLLNNKFVVDTSLKNVSYNMNI